MLDNEVQHVFIIGSKGIPAKYGGYETFVDKLTEYQQNSNIKYHVACAVENLKHMDKEFEYNGAHCFNIEWRRIGSARAIFYDIDALKWSIKYIKKNKIKKPIIYILACRIGPFMKYYAHCIHKLGGEVYVNPDGHEWMRGKWSAPVRKYWKISEKLMVKNGDLIICDSLNIEKYILKTYQNYHPKTVYISYGAETRKSKLSDNDSILANWYQKKGIVANNYYLVVGRFVPENNYESMIREFMNSNTKKDFVLITNVSNEFLNKLKKITNFQNDSRIKFVGTVYDKELLMKIRENAYGYLHGHEVGGTNPSLLEALSSTKLNLLLDVGFNREVGEEGALYWKKNNGDLTKLIDKSDLLTDNEIQQLEKKAKMRIEQFYSWSKIIEDYEMLFLNNQI